MKQMIKGNVAPGYEPVGDAFLENFNEGLEGGAGVCIYKDGALIVDLIGGTKDRAGKIPWDQNTIVPVYSTTKAIAALVIALLVERGNIAYDQPVSDIWPEFGALGKQDITVAQALAHQSGLPGIRDQMEPNDWYDWDTIIHKLETQEPFWAPGTASGYHPVTYGFIAGEIARRTDPAHRTLGTILREDLCAPHDIDFYIGTPATEHERAADLHKPTQLPDFGPKNEATRAAFLRPWSSPRGVPMAQWREAEFAGANGHGTAKAIARLMFLALDGTLDGETYLSAATLDALAKSRIKGPNLVLPFDLNIAAGLMINNNNQFYGPNEDPDLPTLGHSGWGGSCTFVDRKAGFSFAYVMNKQSHYLIGDPRPLRIIKALYSI